MKENFKTIRDTYNNSPLAAREGRRLTEGTLASKLTGMNTDHAADQQKLVRLVMKWKKETILIDLGLEETLAHDAPGILDMIHRENAEKMRAVGGAAAWDLLSEEEQAKHDLNAVQKVLRELGEAAYANLSDARKHDLELFVWAGCCMHKELNSVKGGNTSMQAFWSKNNLVGPVRLANRDNAAILDSACTVSELTTDAERRAAEVSSCGAIKLASLAGALFNHKDDKKGQQDSYKIWMKENHACNLKFPDTSNTRYQSYPDALAVLLVRRLSSINYMYRIKDRKASRTLNHMEQNILTGLHDIPTLTEAAVNVLYAQAVTHPYMLKVRAPGTESVNALDLGPLHENICSFIQRLIDNPDLLIGPDASYLTGSMDGIPWGDTDAVDTVMAMLPELPHIRGALVAFLEGALETWTRFSAEYAPDGVIARTSSSDRRRAWLPATNDINEGALGNLRLHARSKPNSTIFAHNALATSKRNHTEAFLVATCNSDDETFIRREGRDRDASGRSAKIRKKQHVYDDCIVEKKLLNDEKKAAGEEKRRAELASTNLITDLKEIRGLNCAQLDLQIELHRELKVHPMGPKSHYLRKAAKVTVLTEAIQHYLEKLGDTRNVPGASNEEIEDDDLMYEGEADGPCGESESQIEPEDASDTEL